MRLHLHLLFVAGLAAISALIVRVMIRVGTLDHPGERSSHARPTPKGGGVGIVAAFVVGLLVLHAGGARALTTDARFAGLLAASLSIAAVSYSDDVRSWSFKVKLAAQMAAAGLAIACGLRLRVLHLPFVGAVQTGIWGLPLTAAWVLLATNAMNFIDGLNGLASGTAAIACLVLAGIALHQGDGFIYAASLALAAGILGFLPFNYPRARIFMGDVGSQFCGFVLAMLGVLAAGLGPQTVSVLLVPMMLAGVLFDVAFTLVRRALTGERITQAHRGHLYQVAHRCGMPAWQVTLVYWAMAAWGGACALWFQGAPAQWPVLLAAVALPQAAWITLVALRARRVGLRW